MFISFVPPKEMNQRTEALKGQARERSEQKEAGKDNRNLFFANCTRPFPPPKNRVRFAPFPVCPRALIVDRMNLIIHHDN